MYEMLSALNRLDSERSATMTRLATGHRINRAADDPSGVVALASLNSSMTKVDAALDGNQRSQSVLNTADSTLQEVGKLTAEIERLANAAADPNATSAEKAAYQTAVDQNLDSIDALITNANFAGSALFTGTNGITGTSASPAYTDVKVYNAANAAANKVFNVVFTVGTKVVTVDGVAVGTANAAGDQINFASAGYSCSFTVANIAATVTSTITVTAAQGALFQLGDSATTQTRLDMAAGITTAELGDSVNGYLSSLRSGGTNSLTTAGTKAVSIATKASSQVAIADARVGSFNKFQVGTSINALNAVKEGLTDAIQNIDSTDYAADTAELQRQNTLMDAATSLLSLACSQQSNVLALLLK